MRTYRAGEQVIVHDPHDPASTARGEIISTLRRGYLSIRLVSSGLRGDHFGQKLAKGTTIEVHPGNWRIEEV